MPSFLVSRKKTIPLVLSEEMFMVDQDSGVRWQTKIRKLGLFMRETDTVPLIVLRDPQEATISLQRELGFGKKHHIWTAILSALVFPFTNPARVYDYKYVFKVLKEAHFKEVRLVSFDQLTSGYIPLTSITGHPDSAKIRIGLENKAPGNQTVGACCRWIWMIYPLRGRRRFYTNILANISSEANNQLSLGRLGELGTPNHRLSLIRRLSSSVAQTYKSLTQLCKR